MRIAFLEDAAIQDLGPVASMRPVFELVCGQFTLRERLLFRFGGSEWGAFFRTELEETYREQFPQARVNDWNWLREGSTLLINGRWLPTLEALAGIREGDAGIVDGSVAYVTLAPHEFPSGGGILSQDVLQAIARTRRQRPAAGRLIQHPWNLVDRNAEQLQSDFRLRRFGHSATDFGRNVELLGSIENIYVDKDATVDPFVVLDARRGPISVEAGAVLRSFTSIEGPCHVGAGAELFRAQVRGATTIGPGCRVGGEVESSILHAYVNKYHTGFLGHSYACPWVNLGALSTTSDLKNDYSLVKVPVRGEPVETGTTKVGCFLGDHTKVALGSLFDTGSSVGIFSTILPSGELLPRYIPPFTRVARGELRGGVDVARAIETARKVMARRNCELSPAMERLIWSQYELTHDEREAALWRAHEQAARGYIPKNGRHSSVSNDSASLPSA